MFEEQVAWAVDAGVDYIVGETFSWGQEALIALDVIKRAKQPAVITLAMHQEDVTREGWAAADACRRLADAGADVVGLNCIRGPETMPCHGADAKGNKAMGAPNLTDAVWLYGRNISDIVQTIRQGRTGLMPAWRDRLGDDGSALVAAWVYAQSHAAPATRP